MFGQLKNVCIVADVWVYPARLRCTVAENEKVITKTHGTITHMAPE